MAIPIQSIEELINMSYVSAVVSYAGATYDIPIKDYGVDMTVRKIDSIDGQRMDMGSIFDCQLKATINWDEDEEYIIYDLDVATYNKLLHRKKHSCTPCFLIVMCLPKKKKDWLQVSDESLTIKKCCYYYLVNGKPTENKSTIRVRIPRKQKLTPTSVNDLINKISEGGVS